MAIYHFAARIVKRSAGQSAVNTSAYINKDREKDERLEKTFDYSKKNSEVKFAETLFPDGAKSRYNSASELWNDIEKIEKRADAQLAQRIDVALPRELSTEHQIKLAREFCKKWADEGRAISYAIHDHGDGNPHIDAMITIRSWDSAKSKWGKKSHFVPKLDRDGNMIPNPKRGDGQRKFLGKDVKNTDRADLLSKRQWWADVCNKHLEKNGFFRPY